MYRRVSMIYCSMFNAVQRFHSFSCSGVVFVTNFIGVKKAETPQLFGLSQSRDVILIAVRPDCAAPAALPLLLLSFPTPLRLSLFAKFLFSLQALQNHRRRVQSDFSTLSLSFTPYPALPEVSHSLSCGTINSVAISLLSRCVS